MTPQPNPLAVAETPPLPPACVFFGSEPAFEQPARLDTHQLDEFAPCLGGSRAQ